MKTKIFVIFICISVVLCGCVKNNNLKQAKEDDLVNSNENNNTNNNQKDYFLIEIPYTKDIKQIDYVIIDGYGRKTIFADNKLYVYSEKKYLNETHWKSVDFDLTGYRFIGIDVAEIMFMSQDSIAIFNGNVSTIEVYNKNDFYRDYTYKIWKNYNDYIFYNYGINRINDGYIILNDDKKIGIPENEVIINNYIINHRIFKNNELYIRDIFYSDKNNFYYIGYDEKDKCNEYADVECEYKLIQINYFNNLLNDYQNNISYFDGHFLITKENKMYEVSYK